MMGSSEKLCLQWNDFKENITSSFRNLREDNDFTDVTLVCDEDKQIKAHKVLLSSSSLLLRRILLNNPHQHPLIYLKGIEDRILQSILQFMYLGQIEIAHEDLQQFIDTAKDLEVNGLIDVEYGNLDSKNDKPANEITEQKSKEDFQTIEFKNDFSENLVLISELTNELNSQNQGENEPKRHNCDKCEDNFPGKRDLKKHIRTVHEGLTYPLSNADRVRMYKERKKSLIPAEILREMNKAVCAKQWARRMEDKDYDEMVLQKNRERKRRFREKKALEEALANKMDGTDIYEKIKNI